MVDFGCIFFSEGSCHELLTHQSPDIVGPGVLGQQGCFIFIIGALNDSEKENKENNLGKVDTILVAIVC